MTYYPPKSWAVLVPTSLVCAFFAVPLIYAACNILSTPKVDSIDTIWDEHSREPLGQLVSDNECVQGRVLCPFRNVITLINTSSPLHQCRSSIVPAICDLDVLAVNRLLDLNEVNATNNGK